MAWGFCFGAGRNLASLAKATRAAIGRTEMSGV